MHFWVAIEYFFLPCYALLNVFFIQTYFKSTFAIRHYESSYIIINNWFIFHIYNTLLLAWYFPTISIQKMIKLVIFWEILENLIVPMLGIYIENEFMKTQYRESLPDIAGDLIAPIPSLCYLYYKKSKKHMKRHLKIKHL